MSKHDETLTPMAHSAQNSCFGCGPANPHGLHLEFLLAEDLSVVSTPVVPPGFDGHPGYLHGGITATLLDETMSKAVRARGCVAMARRMEVDYLRPVPNSAPLRIEGHVTHREGRNHWCEAKIMNEHGTVLAQSKGWFVEISIERGIERAVAKPPDHR